MPARPLLSAQQIADFYRDCGVDCVMDVRPGGLARPPSHAHAPFQPSPPSMADPVSMPLPIPTNVVGARDALEEAVRLMRSVTSRESLADAIRDFDGFSIKRTATQMVFADGRPDAPVMIVGEAPGADEDRIGRPFVGAAGQLLDKMFAAIGRARTAQDPAQALYITNVLNWRPPGNRTPNPTEIDLARPFIEKHIALVNPPYLVAAGSVALKALLRVDTGITKIHGVFQDFTPLYPDFFPQGAATQIPCLPLFHPSYLLRSPEKKRDAWDALQVLRDRLANR